MPTWVLLTYRVPRLPTAARVFVWRRLRRLGAVLLHDAVWALPRTPFTQEQAQWLASEIRDLKGEASLWLADAFPAAADTDLVGTFSAQADRDFARIVTLAQQNTRTAAALSRDFQDACRRDYFASPLRVRARAALLALPPRPAASTRRKAAPKRRKPP